MKSQRIMSILAISKQYRQRPSEIIGINNDYEAFCFDECCTYMLSELNKENPREPRFEDEHEKNNTNNNDLIDWLKAKS